MTKEYEKNKKGQIIMTKEEWAKVMTQPQMQKKMTYSDYVLSLRREKFMNGIKGFGEKMKVEGLKMAPNLTQMNVGSFDLTGQTRDINADMSDITSFKTNEFVKRHTTKKSKKTR